MLCPGKGDEGYILLDVLVAIFLIMMGFGVIFASIRMVISAVAKIDMKVTREISERNERVEDFEIIIQF